MSKPLLPLLVVIFLPALTWAEDPVYFADPNLKAAVEEHLWISDPTLTDMLNLTELSCLREWGAQDNGITDLTGLEYATNLQSLNLRMNRVSDLSVLSALTNLELLDISQNRVVSDLSPLSGLTNLRDLNLHENAVSDLTPLSGLSNLDTLTLRFNEISDISPLSALTNLRYIDLGDNHISDLGPLSSLPHVSTLCLWRNDVSDLAPLSGMMELSVLDLDTNHIGDISSLSGLSNLRELDLASNEITDISPLCALTSLTYLDLQDNPLPQEAYDVHIPLIAANNRRISIEHDFHAGRLLSTSSTLGGSVVDPGEGEFLYAYNTLVRLEADPDPYFAFAGWCGTYPTVLNPVYFTMVQDYQMQATFLSVLETLYVDDDAWDDPGPGDAALSDPNENGTAEHPFDRIQEALNVAGEGATILVRPGTYRENIDVRYKNVRLIGRAPNDPTRSSWPVIEGAGAGPVVRFDGGEEPDCTLTGFVITQGKGPSAGAILCDGASPTIAHCLIVGNRSTGSGGAAIHCQNSQAVLSNCTIADNCTGPEGAALMLIDSDVTVLNSILWNDRMANEILATGTSDPNIQYCGVRDSWPDWGNIHTDPLFACPGVWIDPDNPDRISGPADPEAILMGGDYHLTSQAGRWDPDATIWVQDEVTSPCIDAGFPSSPVGPEPAPNGGRVNMGAYGGTTRASRTYPSP
mgnify:CR=1 FL=1